MQAPDLELHLLAQLLVERAERLVHQHELRLEHQRARDRDALLLAAGELRRPAAAEAAELHHVQRALDPLRDLVARHAAHRQREADVLGHRHVREQRVVLEHHADLALVRRQARQRLALEQDLAGGRRLEAGEHHQRRRLARARGPEQRQELAALDVEMEIVDDARDAVVGLADADEADDGVRHAGRR